MKYHWLWISIIAGMSIPAHAEVAGSPFQEILRSRVSNTGKALVIPDAPEVYTFLYDIPAHGRFPVHQHLYPRYLYVLDGQIEITVLDTNQKLHYKKGDFIIEAQHEWHYGVNDGDTVTRLLVIDHVQPGTASNVVLKSPTR